MFVLRNLTEKDLDKWKPEVIQRLVEYSPESALIVLKRAILNYSKSGINSKGMEYLKKFVDERDKKKEVYSSREMKDAYTYVRTIRLRDFEFDIPDVLLDNIVLLYEMVQEEDEKKNFTYDKNSYKRRISELKADSQEFYDLAIIMEINSNLFQNPAARPQEYNIITSALAGNLKHHKDIFVGYKFVKECRDKGISLAEVRKL